MKTASAIKYGGVLVDADDCNESSYLQLGLVCPCCHRSVFWVKPQTRVSKLQKTFPVDAYFGHPKAVSYEEALACSERVGRISPKERKQNLEKAKRQRLKLFETWFWQIIDAHWINSKQADFDANRFLLIGAVENDDGDTEVVFPVHETHVIINGLGKNLEVAFESAEFAFSQFGGIGSDRVFSSALLRDGDAQVTDVWQNLGALTREPLHQAITKEAISFLGAKTNRHIVRALWMSFSVGSEFLSDDLIEGYKNYTPNQRAIIFYRLVGFVFALIPWADEFARLTNRSEIPTVEASYIGAALKWFFSCYKNIPIEGEHPKTICDMFLEWDEPGLKGMDFDREVDEAALIRATNQLQYNGGRLLKEIKSKRPKKLGFG